MDSNQSKKTKRNPMPDASSDREAQIPDGSNERAPASPQPQQSESDEALKRRSEPAHDEPQRPS